MGREITIIYPEHEKELKERIMAARREWRVDKIDFTSLESDLKNLMAMFEELYADSSKYEINEAKMSVGFAKDTEGKIQVGIAAKLLHIISGEISGEVGETLSENQLFEIVIKRKD